MHLLHLQIIVHINNLLLQVCSQSISFLKLKIEQKSLGLFKH